MALVAPEDTYLLGSFDVSLLFFAADGLYGVSVDLDAGTWSTTKDGSAFQSDSFSPQECKIAICNGTSAFAKDMRLNFGQRPWAYTPPSGYLALCTKNLPDPLVKPKEHFKAVTYTGNGGTQSVDVGFEPGLTWHKCRNYNSSNALFDFVRGGDKVLSSNGNGSEITNPDMITAFSSDGFTMGADAVQAWINQSGNNYISWNFKGGPAVTNNDGDVESQVSVNKDM